MVLILILHTLMAADSLAGVVSLSLDKKQDIHPPIGQIPVILKRDGVDVELDNKGYGYYVELDIGTPAQTISVHIDTGSSDLWLMGEGNSRCSTSLNYAREGDINCTGLLFFDPSKSSTLTKQSQKLDISYLDTTFAQGTLVRDKISVSGVTVDEALFSVATEFNTTEGVFGIGFPSQESVTNLNGGQFRYDNFPMKLKSSGAIDSVSYSLYLNSVEASSGTITFGGIDHSKYAGTMTVVSMVSDFKHFRTAEVVAMAVEFTSLTWILPEANGNVTLLEGSSPAILDSGSTICRLPLRTFQTLLDTLDGTYLQSLEAGIVYCDLATENDLGSLEFQFNDAVINVDFKEFLIPVQTTDGEPYKQHGRQMCMIGASPDASLILLGDSFLHNAYVVYDLENKKVGLAQANINSDNEDVEAIGTNGIPSASTDTNAVFKSSFASLTTHSHTSLDLSVAQSVASSNQRTSSSAASPTTTSAGNSLKRSSGTFTSRYSTNRAVIDSGFSVAPPIALVATVLATIFAFL